MPVYFLPVEVVPIPEPWQGGYANKLKVDKKVYNTVAVLRAGIALSTFANVLASASVQSNLSSELKTQSSFRDPNVQKRKNNQAELLKIILLG